nr:hypothetical protein [Atlanticothrix silvestris]
MHSYRYTAHEKRVFTLAQSISTQVLVSHEVTLLVKLVTSFFVSLL